MQGLAKLHFFALILEEVIDLGETESLNDDAFSLPSEKDLAELYVKIVVALAPSASVTVILYLLPGIK